MFSARKCSHDATGHDVARFRTLSHTFARSSASEALQCAMRGAACVVHLLRVALCAMVSRLLQAPDGCAFVTVSRMF